MHEIKIPHQYQSLIQNVQFFKSRRIIFYYENLTLFHCIVQKIEKETVEIGKSNNIQTRYCVLHNHILFRSLPYSIEAKDRK